MAAKRVKKRFVIKSSLREMAPLVKNVLLCSRENGASDHVAHDIKLALEEALINAMKHGNNFNEKLPVVVDLDLDEEKAKISVRDKGRGYDYKSIPDPTTDENIAKSGGRGIFLIMKLMDKVRFNRAGNRIEMVKYIK